MINAILLIAGNSLRFTENNDNKLKQYVKINNIELFLYPLKTLLSISDIDNIILVVRKDYIKETRNTVIEHNEIFKNSTKDLNNIHIIEGGFSRQESVFNALKYIKFHLFNDLDKDLVIVLDGARALVSKEIIIANIDAFIKDKDVKGTTTYLDSTDSLMIVENNSITSYVDRDKIKRIETPQTFRFNTLYKAHLSSTKIRNDDLSLVLAKDPFTKIKLIKGDQFNFKVTTKEDFLLMKEILENK